MCRRIPRHRRRSSSSTRPGECNRYEFSILYIDLSLYLVVLTDVVRSTSPSALQARRHDWTVQPGYSSGASSGALGDEEQDELEDVAPLRDEVILSRHTSILALSELRHEKQLHGNLASTVVRIEVRCNAFKFCSSHEFFCLFRHRLIHQLRPSTMESKMGLCWGPVYLVLSDW